MTSVCALSKRLNVKGCCQLRKLGNATWQKAQEEDSNTVSASKQKAPVGAVLRSELRNQNVRVTRRIKLIAPCSSLPAHVLNEEGVPLLLQFQKVRTRTHSKARLVELTAPS